MGTHLILYDERFRDFSLAVVVVLLIAWAIHPVRATARNSIDSSLRDRLRKQDVSPVDPGPDFSDARVKLGKKLFWDKLLSGNKDISCGACHHPAQGTSDGLPLSIGTGAEGDHFGRTVGEDRQFIPRNAQDVWNRGSPEWRTLFRDMRVRKVQKTGVLLTPAGFELPETVENLQAAQAMIPVTARDEMRGDRGDFTIDGDTNQLALIPEGQFEEIWDQLWDRIQSYPGYRRLFRQAYPEEPLDELGFAHGANAIAAYQIEAFTFLDSPWDRYLKGDNDALSRQQKQGALLFYGKGQCGDCHAGSLMTDQRAHNLGVPQLGPGKDPDEPYDLGFYRETGDPEDRFAFRTPPLRNVTVSGPWMHNGAYGSLRAAVQHHRQPEASLKQYDADQLGFDLRGVGVGPIPADELLNLPESTPGKDLIPLVRSKKREHNLILKTLDPKLESIELDESEVDKILAFLGSLTSPSVRPENGDYPAVLKRTVPDTVPSGLPVTGFPD